MRAIMDRVFIKLDPREEKKGGIILVDNFQTSRNVGVVISKGEEVKSVKVGERVIFHDFDELESPEEDVVVVREHSLLGVIE
jgi:co-chaperonin GroES (HSP10)